MAGFGLRPKAFCRWYPYVAGRSGAFGRRPLNGICRWTEAAWPGSAGLRFWELIPGPAAEAFFCLSKKKLFIISVFLTWV